MCDIPLPPSFLYLLSIHPLPYFPSSFPSRPPFFCPDFPPRLPSLAVCFTPIHWSTCPPPNSLTEEDSSASEGEGESEGEGASLRDPTSPSLSSLWFCSLHPSSLRLPPASQAQQQLSSSGGGTLDQQLRRLLPRVVDHRNIVVLVAASGAYASMLSSFVCNLRRLLLPLPLVAAFDDALFRFASDRGLPVVRVTSGEADAGPACAYGTPCFKRLTKVKSRIVLQLLRKGVHVLWSDIDIVWFRDPLPEMLAYGAGVFPVQSDAGYDREPPNGQGVVSPHGFINSGFYFARAEAAMVEAFEAIVKHASESETSEQPSFYAVLCGAKGEYTRGEDECVWPGNGLRVAFMSRWLHPNGLIHRVWFRSQSAKLCQQKGCATLHNNWVRGKEKKLNRLRLRGFWFYDPSNDMCRYDWYYKMRGVTLEKDTFLSVVSPSV